MYAKDKSFDPLNPENWYSQSNDMILAVKVLLSPHSTIASQYILIYYN